MWRYFILVLLFNLLGSASAADTKKIALLIGNAEYAPEVGPLLNPPKDVATLKNALEGIGFDVTTVLNGSRGRMVREIDEFTNRLGGLGQGAIGFFYYSGHGVARPQTSLNFLIPTDISSLYDINVWADSIAVDDFLVREFKLNAPNASTFIVLDACRSTLRTPWRSGEKGFVNPVQENGIFLAFSTSQYEAATDVGDNVGPYANALALELQVPGQDESRLFQKVKRRVFEATRRQRPTESNGFMEPVILNSSQPPSVSLPPSIAEPVVSPAGPNLAISGTEHDFCEDLKTLIALSSQSFTPIKRGLVKTGVWETGSILAAFDHCRINSGSNVSYNCFTEPTHSLLEQRDKQEKVFRDAANCLANSWKARTGPNGVKTLEDMRSGRIINIAVQELPSTFNQGNIYTSLQIFDPRVAADAFEELDGGKPAAHPTVYCEQLQRVADSAAMRFEDILGVRYAGSSYRTKVVLNGWENCDLTDLDANRRYYSCKLPKLQSKTAISTFIVDMSDELQRCVGKDWQARTRKNSSGLPVLELNSVSSNNSIELRPKLTDDGWQVSLDVNSGF